MAKRSIAGGVTAMGKYCDVTIVYGWRDKSAANRQRNRRADDNVSNGEIAVYWAYG